MPVLGTPAILAGVGIMGLVPTLISSVNNFCVSRRYGHGAIKGLVVVGFMNDLDLFVEQSEAKCFYLLGYLAIHLLT